MRLRCPLHPDLSLQDAHTSGQESPPLGATQAAAKHRWQRTGGHPPHTPSQTWTGVKAVTVSPPWTFGRDGVTPTTKPCWSNLVNALTLVIVTLIV